MRYFLALSVVIFLFSCGKTGDLTPVKSQTITKNASV